LARFFYLDRANACNVQDLEVGKILAVRWSSKWATLITQQEFFMSIRLSLVTLGLAVGLAFSSSALAQESDFSNQQLDQFVNAQTQVMEIRDEYVERIEATEDRDEAMALEQEANQVMVDAVENTGLSVDTYSAIAQSASESPDLAERIRALMSE
jgi:hypothetical protein